MNTKMYGNRRNHKILFWTFVVRSSPVKILPFRLGLVPQIAASLLYDEVLWGIKVLWGLKCIKVLWGLKCKTHNWENLKCLTHNWENLSVDGKVNQFFGLIAYIETNQSLKLNFIHGSWVSLSLLPFRIYCLRFSVPLQCPLFNP